MTRTFKLYVCYLKKIHFSCYQVNEIEFEFGKIISRQTLIIEFSIFCVKRN